MHGGRTSGPPRLLRLLPAEPVLAEQLEDVLVVPHAFLIETVRAHADAAIAGALQAAMHAAVDRHRGGLQALQPQLTKAKLGSQPHRLAAVSFAPVRALPDPHPAQRLAVQPIELIE